MPGPPAEVFLRSSTRLGARLHSLRDTEFRSLPIHAAQFTGGDLAPQIVPRRLLRGGGPHVRDFPAWQSIARPGATYPQMTVPGIPVFDCG
jgi:hypothetical protein